MNCPVDGRELQLTYRDGIELDYCPECRGIWFDRGELDKVIERSDRQVAAMASAPPAPSTHAPPQKSKKKKASSFLSDLLEFG